MCPNMTFTPYRKFNTAWNWILLTLFHMASETPYAPNPLIFWEKPFIVCRRCCRLLVPVMVNLLFSDSGGGYFFSNPWLSRIIWSKFKRIASLQKKMAAFFLHASFWLISLVIMFFWSLIRNQIRFTVLTNWTDFIFLATFQTFSSKNRQTFKCHHFLKWKGYSS